jgi:isoamylase
MRFSDFIRLEKLSTLEKFKFWKHVSEPIPEPVLEPVSTPEEPKHVMPQYITKSGLTTSPGSPYLLGATLNHLGCNFALFSRHATAVMLLFFDQWHSDTPTHILPLDPGVNKTGDVWHIFVYDIYEGQSYGYVVDGPYNPAKGHRFNNTKLLQDPYAQAVVGNYHWDDPSSYEYVFGSSPNALSRNTQKNYGKVGKCVVVDTTDFDWEGDKPLNIPLKETIIYEVHVRGFTKHPSSGIMAPGTYRGVLEKIPYLKELGVTTIEFLPVQGFNHLENFRKNPKTGEQLYNFWGYSTLSFFAPDEWYSANKDGIQAVKEFKEMVKALHREGIEVILDVVYNHTGEGDQYGPIHSFKGLDNSIYYMINGEGQYLNYSGCGNTLNCNHPVVKRLILDSLRYWVVDMHVDGFRFDLAAILGRDQDGNWLPNYSILDEISHDPILSNTKLIAEGWDAAGLYKVGGFPPGWAEWNASYRDAVRGFFRGDPKTAGELARRISGSEDLFHFKREKLYHSINFVTAHDGFTLNDLVSYNQKHNEENAENEYDGNPNNLSWNCGFEGETNDPQIMELRDRQMKNMFAVLMISLGTPMMLSGDEMKFTKRGNNNTYCHDNDLNWLNWSLSEQHRDYFTFCQYMIHFRKSHPALQREEFFKGVDQSQNDIPDIGWHGVEVGKPDWQTDSHSLAFMLDGSMKETGADKDDNNIYVAINAFWSDLHFRLPKPGQGKTWHVAVNTSQKPGFYEVGKEPAVQGHGVIVKSRSLIILIDK